MGIPLFIEYAGDSLDGGTHKYLVGVYQNQVKAIMDFQDEETGLWHTLLDDSTSYIETSGSAGIVSGLLLGMKNGFITEKNYRKNCRVAIRGLLGKINDEGYVIDVSAGTAISRNRNDYKNIILKSMAYGQALMIYALVSTLNCEDAII